MKIAMKPITCPACQGDELADVDIGQQFFVRFLRLGLSRPVACLRCCGVTQYLNDATLAVLRDKVGHPSKAEMIDHEL